MGCGILTWHLKTMAQWWGPPNNMAMSSKNLKTISLQPVYGSLLAHELNINHVSFTFKENKKIYNVFKGLKSTYDDVDVDVDVNDDDDADDVDDDDDDDEDDDYEYDDDEDGYIYSDDDDDDDDYFAYRRL